MRRRSMGRKHSRKLFKRTANRVNGRNYSGVHVMRGGIRL